MRRAPITTTLCAGLLAAGLSTADSLASAPPDRTAAGTAGIGDRFYPYAGNGGYDVAAYNLSLDYDPATGRLEAETRITADAEQRLRRFDLDLRGLDVNSVAVGGRGARFRRRGQELIVRPRKALREGERFHVEVE